MTTRTRLLSRLCLSAAVSIPALTIPASSIASPGVYGDCTNLHARQIVNEVNKHLALNESASCPPGGPTLDAACLDDCGLDTLDFTTTPSLSDVDFAGGCDTLTANDCAQLHFDNPQDYLTGNASKPFQYRFVPLCANGSGDHDWQLGTGGSMPACSSPAFITCVDGSRAMYWAASAEGGGNDWTFRFAGGNSGCAQRAGVTAAATCWEGIQDGEDSSAFGNKRTVTELGLLGDAGFVDTNRVYIDPCGEDRYAGDNVLFDQPLGGGDMVSRFPMVGHRIVKAVLADLASGPTLMGEVGFSSQVSLPPLANADNVVFAGSSAGAIGLSFTLDFLADEIVAISGAEVTVQGLLDSRLMPSLDNEEAEFELVGNGATIYGGPNFDLPPVGTSDTASFHFSEANYLANGAEFDRYGADSWDTPMQADCLSVHGATSEEWRCRDQAHLVFNHIKTPVFVAHSLRDSNQFDAPIEWGDGLHSWEELGDAYCTRQRTQLSRYSDLRNSLADGGATGAGNVGVWAANFSYHEFFKDDCTLTSVTISKGEGGEAVEYSLKQAFEQWQAGNEVIMIDGFDDAETHFNGCLEKQRPLTCPGGPSLVPALTPASEWVLVVVIAFASVLLLWRRDSGDPA